MSFHFEGKTSFPPFSGAKCYMMPIIQGRAESLPPYLAVYAQTVEKLFIEGEQGKIGFLTIDESFVKRGRSQRGYGEGLRAIHTEACLSNQTISWGRSLPRWGKNSSVNLAPELRVIIANSIDDTCMVWNKEVRDTTPNGDLSSRSSDFPYASGQVLKACEVVNMGIWTPHECLPQEHSRNRQFIRVVGSGVSGREEHFDLNPLVKAS